MPNAHQVCYRDADFRYDMGRRLSRDKRAIVKFWRRLIRQAAEINHIARAGAARVEAYRAISRSFINMIKGILVVLISGKISAIRQRRRQFSSYFARRRPHRRR